LCPIHTQATEDSHGDDQKAEGQGRSPNPADRPAAPVAEFHRTERRAAMGAPDGMGGRPARSTGSDHRRRSASRRANWWAAIAIRSRSASGQPGMSGSH